MSAASRAGEGHLAHLGANSGERQAAWMVAGLPTAASWSSRQLATAGRHDRLDPDRTGEGHTMKDGTPDYTNS